MLIYPNQFQHLAWIKEPQHVRSTTLKAIFESPAYKAGFIEVAETSTINDNLLTLVRPSAQYYEAERCYQNCLVYDSETNTPDIDATLEEWDKILSQTVVWFKTIDAIEKNDLNNPKFDNILTTITMMRLTHTRGSQYFVKQ